MMRYVMLLMLMVLAAGCGEKSEPVAEPSVPAEAMANEAFDALFSQARERYHEGDTDAAVDLLTEGLADPQFADNHATIFRALLELLLMEDRVIDAQTNYLAMLNASPETAAQTFSMIPTHLKRKEDAAPYLSWTKQMIDADLPSNVLESAYGFYVDANVQAGQFDALNGLADTVCARFGGEVAARILARPISALVDREQFDTVTGILATLSATGDASAADFVVGTEMTMAAARGEWDAVVAAFKTKGAALPDTACKLALRTVADRAMAANRGSVVDPLCEFVLTSMPADATGTRSQAVTSYIDVAVKAKQYDDAMVRLQRLKAWGVDATQLGSRLNAIFYDVMGQASADAKEAALDMVETVLESSGEDRKAQFQALLMDGSVLCDDYRRALGVLESGFRSDDAAWHSMAVNKVGAHLALQEGRIDDAVAMFRVFMDHVATWTEFTLDPSTGIAHTRDMSMGFNAKRIGNILRDAGRTEEAAKAYAEAEDYYDAALAAATPGSKEAAYIQKEMDDLQSAASVAPPVAPPGPGSEPAPATMPDGAPAAPAPDATMAPAP